MASSVTRNWWMSESPREAKSSRRIRCLWANLLVGLLLILCTAHVDAAQASVILMYSTGSADTHIASLYTVGSASAIQMRTNPVSYKAQFMGITSSAVSSSISVINSETSSMAIIGPAGAQILYMIYSIGAPVSTVMFAPLEQTLNGNPYGGVYVQFNSKTYWMLPSDQAQAVGLMFFLSQRPLLPINQILLAYTTNGVSTYSVEALPALAPVLGITGLAVKSSGGQSYSSGTYSSVFSSAPGIVYQLLESDENYPSQWIQQMVSDGNFIKANTTIGTTFTFDYMTLQAYNDKASAVAVLPPQNMLTASPIPGMESTEYQAAQDFVSQVSTSIATVSTNSEKNFIMAGWVSGWGLVQALNMYTGSTLVARSAFHDTLANAQSMFLVSDLFYGTMGPSCSSVARSQGAVCSCRWAGNNVWFHTLTKSGNSYDSTPLHGALFQYAQGTCANIDSAPTPLRFFFPRTVHVAGLSPQDNSMISSVCSDTVGAIEAVTNTTQFWHHSSHAFRGYCIQTSMNSATADLAKHQSSYVTTSLMGVIPDAVVAASTPPSTLILDFMPQTTQLHIAKANYIYLFPTLEQELYVLAKHLSGEVITTSVVCAVVSSSSFSSSVVALLKKTLISFGIEASADHLLQPTGGLGSSIPTSCTHTFAIGASSGDAAGIAAYLGEHANAVVLMSFEDLTKEYSAFFTSFGSGTAATTDRLLFATSLPTWTGATLTAGALSGASALSTVEEFVQTLAPTAQTPAAARAFIVAMLYDQLTMGTHWGQPDIEAALYGNETVRIGGMVFGPFSQSWGAQGVINYGAKDISVWSFTRVIDPSTELLEQPVNPALVYNGAATSMAVAAGPSDSEDCYVEQRSSSDVATTSTTKDPHNKESDSVSRPTTTISPDSSSREQHSSSDGNELRTVLYVLLAILGVLVLYIAILLLQFFGFFQQARNCLLELSCLRGCCGSNSAKDLSKVRVSTAKHNNEDRELQRAVLSISPVSETSPSGLTAIFVEVEQWRSLWAWQPEVMARVAQHCRRCIWRAAVEHNIYVMHSMEGMWILLSSSANAGLDFAHEVITSMANQTRADTVALRDGYARQRCGDSPVEGLRLRIALNTGGTTRYTGPLGQTLFRGFAVDGAIGAAHAVGVCGSVVLTASALKECGIAHDAPDVQRAGRNPLTPDHMDGQLYVLQKIPSVDAVLHEERDATNVTSALQFAEMASGSAEGDVWLQCMRLLEMHYANIAEQARIADLRCIAEFFILPEAFLESNASSRGEYTDLLRSVSRQIASMIACRHGLPRTTLYRRSKQTLPGIKDVSAEETDIQCGGVLGSATAGNPAIAQRGSAHERRKRGRSATLRHFAYASGDDGDM